MLTVVYARMSLSVEPEYHHYSMVAWLRASEPSVAATATNGNNNSDAFCVCCPLAGVAFNVCSCILNEKKKDASECK